MGTGTGAGAGTGTGTGEESRRRTPDGNGDGSEDSSGDGNGVEDNENESEDRIVEGGREVKKRKKPKHNCRRHVGNGGDLGGKRKSVEKKGLVQWLPTQIIWRVTRKQGGAQGTQGSRKNCTRRESVSALSRLIRGIRSEYHCAPLGRINASGIE